MAKPWRKLSDKPSWHYTDKQTTVKSWQNLKHQLQHDFTMDFTMDNSPAATTHRSEHCLRVEELVQKTAAQKPEVGEAQRASNHDEP